MASRSSRPCETCNSGKGTPSSCADCGRDLWFGKPPATVFTQVYEYEGKRYEVLGMGKMKDPVGRQWMPVMIYRDEGTRGFDATFVRDLREFLDRFKLIETKQLPGGA
jgi:hypothetical protein